MKPSTYQQAIYDAYQASNSNLLIGARAGSGKTHTSIEMMKLSPDVSKHYLAFNKSIDKEVGGKLTHIPNVKHSTLHSLGMKSLMKHSSSRLEVSNQKVWNIGKELNKKWGMKKDFVPTIMRLSSMIDAWRITLCNNTDDFVDRTFNMGFDYKIEDILYLEEMVAAYERYNENPKLIDFVDMIYLPTTNPNIEILTHAKVLYLDECQDLSNFQHAFADKIIKQNKARFVAVGDKFQAIYSFAGSNSDSFDLFKEKEGGVQELPLSICYRCPDLIVDEANAVYDVMKKNDFRGQGEIEREGTIDMIKKGDMVICRNTKPLIQLFMKLLQQGKDAKIKGSDIGKGLVSLITPYRHMRIGGMINALIELLDKQEQKLLNMEIKQPKKHRSYVGLLEKIQICIFVSDKYDTVDKIISLFKRIFSDRDFDGITLSTIHKSKGLEAKNIFFVNQSLIPSEFARTEEQLIQEKNLRYVAITRAEEKLTYLQI